MHLQSRTAGDMAGPSGGQGSSAHPEKPLIKEDNALATLQAAFPKEVKYKTVKYNSRSAQLDALCTSSHGLTGRFGNIMMSHQESRPVIVRLCQSCCNSHQASMQYQQHLQALFWLPLWHAASVQDLLSRLKWANDCHVQCSGKFCEEIDVMGGFHVARGTTTTKQAAKRWAAMRLLQQLKHVILPAFYSNTSEGWWSIQ